MISVAVLTGLWAGTAFLVFSSEAGLNDVASRLAAGDPFKKTSLASLRPKLDALEQSRWPTPESLRNAAAIEFRLAELEAETGGKIAENPQFALAQKAMEAELRAVPLDAFTWAALFWLVKTRDGMSETVVPYLRMSYLVGPHEGWVAVRRNRVAVTVLAILPKDLADLVTAEFTNLVSSNYIRAAAEIVTGPGWAYRDRLLEGLANVPTDQKRNLADAIYELGVDLEVPGVGRRHGARPWQ